jgi:hypothetical protein
MIERMVVTVVPWWQVVLSVTLLVRSVVGALWLAGCQFGANTLLSGQLPNLRGLWKIVARAG